MLQAVMNFQISGGADFEEFLFVLVIDFAADNRRAGGRRRTKAEACQHTHRGRMDRMAHDRADIEVRIHDQILEQLGYRHHGDPLMADIVVDDDRIQFARLMPVQFVAAYNGGRRRTQLAAGIKPDQPDFALRIIATGAIQDRLDGANFIGAGMADDKRGVGFAGNGGKIQPLHFFRLIEFRLGLKRSHMFCPQNAAI